MDVPIPQGVSESRKPEKAISLSPFRPFDENRLASADPRLGRLAPVLNRAFETSIAVRALANLMTHCDVVAAAESSVSLSPSQREAFFTAIAVLSADLNKALCDAADFLDGACRQPR